jgi:hypothetical protein
MSNPVVNVGVTSVVVRRRTKVVLGLMVATCVAAYALLPRLAEARIRAQLAERGFPNADLEVVSLGLRHLELRNVRLDEGIELGSLELNRGVSLLWSDVDEIAIDRAHVSTTALARVSPMMKRTNASRPSGAPFRRASIKNSVVDVDGTPTRVAATAARKGTSLDVTISVRDPGKRGWSAEARGRIVWDDNITLENGHVEVDVPTQKVGDTTVDGATLDARISGDLSRRVVRGSGTARIGRIAMGSVDVTGLEVPFTFDREGVRVLAARASVAGGELTLDPFFVPTSKPSTDLVLRARGLQLATLLRDSKRVTGSGLLDGFLAMRLDDGSVALQRGELRARRGGRIQVIDASWRKHVAAAQDSPFDVRTNLVNALIDFEYSALGVELAPPASGGALKVSTRGHGRRNRQALDISIAVRGVRDLVARLTGVVSS